MILLRNLRLYPGEKESKLPRKAAQVLRVEERVLRDFRIVRKSLDARKKNDIHWLYAVAVNVEQEDRILARCKNAEAYVPFHYEIPHVVSEHRPVVVGFGPAGMFAALLLAEAGLRPIVLERGGDVDRRRAQVNRFWETGALDPECNVQFGAGGAGAFSDGKLATNTHDPRIAWVLEQLRRFGAGDSVVYDAHPHVGTDRLAAVVTNLKNHIVSLGAEVRFHSRFTGFETENGRICAVHTETPEGSSTLPCHDLILAIGHSARDTFQMLRTAGLPMEAKPFSMGVRIEHRQADVNAARYGETPFLKSLPAAEYKGNVTLPEGDSAYTFCMCPGGYVVAAASETGGVVTNGMSYSGRAGDNANAALLVTLRPADFPPAPDPVLAGMVWQREIERRCFELAGGDYRAPAQTVGDFIRHQSGTPSKTVQPTYRPGVTWLNLWDVLPEKLTATLAWAIPALAENSALRFFADPEAVLTAPETRSSSPVRILREQSLQSPAVRGLYPCGEGAGYAGGITSAAVDGLRCAEQIIG